MMPSADIFRLLVFQSTRPIRGATRITFLPGSILLHFNPRAPYGARHAILHIVSGEITISIHAPHTGRDYTPTWLKVYFYQFQSTRPIRGATWGFQLPTRSQSISIHAPHTGRDGFLLSGNGSKNRFQSTRPIRGATEPGNTVAICMLISIHAPHTGRDSSIRAGESGPGYFNPRAPYGARPDQRCQSRRR